MKVLQAKIHKKEGSGAGFRTIRRKSQRSPAAFNPIALLSRSAEKQELQAKLKVGSPGDMYEQEADRISEQVMTIPEPAAQRQTEEEEPIRAKPLIQCQVTEDGEPIQAKALIRRQTDGEERESLQEKALIQHQTTDDSETVQSKTLIQRQTEEEVRPKSLIQHQTEEDEGPIRAKGDMDETVSDSLQSQLISTKGIGDPLSENTRSFMESRFGRDFGNVRIHTDNNATTMSEELGAQAFTHGSDIYFNEGKYNPDSGSGKQLLAHELTHTAQQGKAARKKPAQVTTISPRIQRFSLKGLLNKAANYIPGYGLICVILGKNPVTGTKVPRTGVNILKGVLGLVPVFGKLWFDRLQKTGAAAKAGAWLDKEITKLNITWSGIKALISEAKNRISIFKIHKGIEIIKEVFGPTYRRIKAFVSAIGTKIKDFILRGALSLAGGAANTIIGVLNKGKAVFAKILNDPIGFVKNFLKAVKLGIDQFKAGFAKHFKNAIFGWLFGTMAKAGITLPKKFDLKGIFSLVMQILGLTYRRIRGMIVKRLGPKGTTIISTIEKSVSFVKRLMTEGPSALWEKLKESMGNLKQMLISKVLAWVSKTIVFKAIMKLASMLNPVGALIQAALAIYNTVMFFIERLNQIKTFVMSIINSIGNIAFGKIKGAANYIENAMAKGMTLIISFLARFIGMGGISKKIRAVIKTIRKPIDKALDKIIVWIVKKGKALFAKGKAAVKGAVKIVFAIFSFEAEGKRNTLQVEGKGKAAEIVIASSPGTPVTRYLDRLQPKIDVLPKGKSDAQGHFDEARKSSKNASNILKKVFEPKKSAEGKTKMDKANRKLLKHIKAIWSLIGVKNKLLRGEAKVGTYSKLAGRKTMTPHHIPQNGVMKRLREWIKVFVERRTIRGKEAGKDAKKKLKELKVNYPAIEGYNTGQGICFQMAKLRHNRTRTMGRLPTERAELLIPRRKQGETISQAVEEKNVSEKRLTKFVNDTKKEFKDDKDDVLAIYEGNKGLPKVKNIKEVKDGIKQAAVLNAGKWGSFLG